MTEGRLGLLVFQSCRWLWLKSKFEQRGCSGSGGGLTSVTAPFDADLIVFQQQFPPLRRYWYDIAENNMMTFLFPVSTTWIDILLPLTKCSGLPSVIISGAPDHNWLDFLPEVSDQSPGGRVAFMLSVKQQQ